MIWWLTRSAAEVPAGDAWLGRSERTVLGRLANPKRRSDWRLGRYTAKVALCAGLGVEPVRVEVLAAPSGAPVALLDGRRAGLELSISHRAGRALAVLAPVGSPVGADLELIEPRSAAFVEEWLAPNEQTLVNRASADERAWLANLLWSAKEASAKARGEGLRLDVRHAEVALCGPPNGEGWSALRVGWGSEHDAGWCRTEREWVITVVEHPHVRGASGGAPHALAADRKVGL